MVLYRPPSSQMPESWIFNMCNWSCNVKKDKSTTVSGMISTQKPLGYGEYSIWMRGSMALGTISSFSLSKQYDKMNNRPQDGQCEINWETTPDIKNPLKSVQATTNIYFNSDPKLVLTGDNKLYGCFQSIQGTANSRTPNRFPTPSSGKSIYSGALQYVIGFYPNKIYWRVFDTNQKRIYERILDPINYKDMVTVCPNVRTPFNVEQSLKYIDKNGKQVPCNIGISYKYEFIQNIFNETDMYPFFNFWHLPFPNKLWINGAQYSDKSIDSSAKCPSSCSKQTSAQMSFIGPLIFKPDVNNKVFNPQDWVYTTN